MPDRPREGIREGIVDLDKFRKSRRVSISCCIIARDEEEYIADAIGSVSELADEVIVVDTGSADGTAEKAEECGAKVFSTLWENDFSKARNLSISKASGEWILIIDADEIIDAVSHSRIREIIETHPGGAFLFKQRTYTDDSDTFGWEPAEEISPFNRGKLGFFVSEQVRLFRNSPSVRYKGFVHENVEESLLKAGNELYSVEDVVVHHYGRMKDSNRVRRKYHNYLHLGEMKLQIEPDNIQSIYELSSQLMTLGRNDEALTHIDRGLELDPGSWKLLYLKGLACLGSGKSAEAEQLLREALEGEKGKADLYNNLGVALIENGKPEEALAVLSRGLDLHGDNANLLRNSASSLLLLGRADEARKRIARALELDPFMPQAHVILAETMVMSKEFDGAADSLGRIRFIPGTNLKVYLKSVQLYIRMHMAREAGEIVERALLDYPGHEGLMLLSGKVKELLGDAGGAAAIYRKMLQDNPENWEVLNSLGCIDERSGNLEQALRYFGEAFRLNPLDCQIEVNLAIVLERLNRDSEAEEHFRRAIARDSDNSFALNGLGCFLSKRMRFAEAIPLFTRAIEARPGDIRPYMNLGLVCEKMNLPAKAAEIYEKVALIDASSISIVRDRLDNLRSSIHVV